MADSFLMIRGDSSTPVKIRLKDNADGTFSVATTATLAADIEIGAVEIKNSVDDTRATVGANGLYVDVQASTGVGSLTETAPTTDTASSGLNGRLQRIAQRITSLIALLPTALGAGGGLKVDGSGTALPVSLATAPSTPVTGTFWQTTQPTSDNGPTWTSVRGVSGAAFVSADATTAAAVTDAPTGGQKLIIRDIVFSSDTAMSLLFEEETSGTDLVKIFVPANGSGQITPRSKWKLATADKKLTVKASVAGNIAVTVSFDSEA